MIQNAPMSGKRTVVLGASTKPERYSNQAVRLLKEYGHPVIPVHPAEDTIEGLPVVHNLREIHGPVDTVSVYLSPEAGAQMADAIISLGPKRVILNPGAESDELEWELGEAGITVEHACTLVMLRTNQF